MKFIFCCLIINFCFKNGKTQLNTLGYYGADKNQISVSGFSSGSSMATQYHVAFSSQVIGAGLIAGAPYYCAGSLGVVGIVKCWILAVATAISQLVEVIDNYASSDHIDSPDNLVGDKVFIFNGRRDLLVNPANGPQIQEFYQHYKSDVLTEFTLDAQHAMPTDHYGNSCQDFEPPFISNCSYNTAFILLNHIYGDLIQPTAKNSQINRNLLKFNQGAFTLGPPLLSSLDTVGYVYVPTYCKTNPGCRLHMAFHGCLMGRQVIGEEFVRNAGYNSVAELNNIIVVYPQVALSYLIPLNPFGCYDWWGYTGSLYATKSGPQLRAFNNMMDRITSQPRKIFRINRPWLTF